MNNLTEKEIKYLRDCVLSSTLLGHEVKMGGRVLRKLDEALTIPAVVGRSEQFVCLCPRNETDNCDRKEPCKECETCPHLRQTNCH